MKIVRVRVWNHATLQTHRASDTRRQTFKKPVRWSRCRSTTGGSIMTRKDRKLLLLIHNQQWLPTRMKILLLKTSSNSVPSRNPADWSNCIRLRYRNRLGAGRSCLVNSNLLNSQSLWRNPNTSLKKMHRKKRIRCEWRGSNRPAKFVAPQACAFKARCKACASWEM